ncbi:DUF5050 domain-containing protein [Paenibacillus sp. UNC451MF]|uniref:DUF5050 domain-containing protein n=1 Tax=Paenibacillus sp. UNC451MF TaxID=1449063 RepID=UPI00068ADE10|nr:DUF5050 domain-containing protein [Paenibacillus sp. UNC451MF]
MWKKTIVFFGMLLIGLSSSSQVLDVQANAVQVQVSIPTFPIAVNGTYMDVNHNEYPPLLYKDVTYSPMTWKNTSALGLSVSWDAVGGLSLQKKDACTPLEQDLVPQTISYEYDTIQTAELTPFSVQVNGKSVDNVKEMYPILLFRNITYFPMTWRFTHDEFGWKTSWNTTRGLSIESCEEKTHKPEQQNSFFNVTNGGLVAVQGDWIYMNPDGKKLVKVNKNGGEEIKLTGDNARSINVVGEWLYYAVANDGIYKIKTDGTQRSQIVDAPHALNTIWVKDNSIYYVHQLFQVREGTMGGNDRHNGIYKINIDGTGDQLLVSGKINYYMALNGNKIYYLMEGEATNNLYAMNLDGSEQVRLQADVSRMTVIDGWIYMVQNNSYQLNKMSLDDSVVIPVYTAEKNIIALSYRDGWIYLVRGSFGIQGAATIERIRVDGSDFEKLTEARAWSLYFAGKTLYFPNDTKLGGVGNYYFEHMDVE